MGEKWQNLPFLGRTCTSVPVPKVGTDAHSTEGNWYRYQKLCKHPFPVRPDWWVFFFSKIAEAFSIVSVGPIQFTFNQNAFTMKAFHAHSK